jgi:eukaryotic-like serine/threonine-protein kinase
VTPPEWSMDTVPSTVSAGSSDIRRALEAESSRVTPARVRLGSVPVNSQQELRFLQDRLALFGQVIFWLSAAFLVVKGTLDLLLGGSAVMPLGRAFHALALMIMLGLWLLCRRRRVFAQSTLDALDWGATLAVCVCFTGKGYFSAQPWGYYSTLLAVGHVTLARSVLVPSASRRTFWLVLASFGAVTLGRLAAEPDAAHALITNTPIRNVVDALSWSLLGAALATVASTVIYGLRNKALRALELGQYTLEEQIGQGSMGRVFRAKHAMLRRPTAIKLLTGDGSETALRRFEREVQLTARLTHPNTISVYDYGRTPDGHFYYAMELLEGKTLEDLVAESGPQRAGRVIHILLQVCGALNEAHGVGLIHRDIKPANIYVCARGGVFDVVKVLDFGLVREFGNPTEVAFTNADAVVGTPLYLSPEAIVTPAEMDARADLYGLGGLAYFLLCGSPPFSGRTMVELCGHHLHTAPPALSRRVPGGLADDLERVILACLAKDPEQRPQSTAELARALRACRDAGTWSELDAERWWQGAAHAQAGALGANAASSRRAALS